MVSTDYHKIPTTSPGADMVSKALFKGFIFGGAYIQRGLYMVGNFALKKLIGLAYSWKANKKKNYVLPNHFPLVLLYICGKFPNMSSHSLYLEGPFNRGFFSCYTFEELIFVGAYFQNSLVCY